MEVSRRAVGTRNFALFSHPLWLQIIGVLKPRVGSRGPAAFQEFRGLFSFCLPTCHQFHELAGVRGLCRAGSGAVFSVCCVTGWDELVDPDVEAEAQIGLGLCPLMCIACGLVAVMESALDSENTASVPLHDRYRPCASLEKAYAQTGDQNEAFVHHAVELEIGDLLISQEKPRSSASMRDFALCPHTDSVSGTISVDFHTDPGNLVGSKVGLPIPLDSACTPAIYRQHWSPPEDQYKYEPQSYFV